MTSYSPDFTSRYRAHYHVCGIDHTIQLRKSLGATPGETADLAGTVSAIFNAVSAKLCTDFTFLSAEQADEGSDIFYPSDTPAAAVGTQGSPGTYTPFQKITHTRFNCRAPGSRSSIELYGLFWEYSNTLDDPDTVAYDGVLTPTDYAPVNTIVALLNTQAFANSGNPNSIWQARALVKVNDFWLKQVRSGGIT
jgi:hypothetical protein